MNELLPISVGAVLGFASGVFGPRRLWPAVTLVVAIIVGFAWSLANGELELSPAFLFFDVGQIVIVAIVCAALARLVISSRRRA